MRTPAVFSLLSLAAFAAEPLKFPSIPPTPPEEAERTFEVLQGFRMDLLAAEPLVTDPVAVAYDEDGRAFVAEMNDYPYTDKAQHKPSQLNSADAPIGKVRLLFDEDGDGRFDRSTVFANGLSWPTGVACWKGGVIVTATPDVWYFKDNDGDGKADLREKLITGFKKLNVQAVMNNPVWGLDNRLYLAGGSNGGEIARPGGKPLALRRADVRLDPRDWSIALVSGGARFGNTRDDWGNRFLCNIRNPAQHIVTERRYLAREPHLPAVDPLVDIAEAGDQLPLHRVSPPEAWRELRAKRWSADTTVRMPRSELVGTGVVTSSSGVTVYRGDAFPPEFRGNIFVADVAGNLFYRLVTQPAGVTFKAKRVDGDREFCASRDVWFRPVNFANAPDGCLHVCDMYREAIEHPWSLPDDIHAALDLERGRDKGRLYRLAPRDFKGRPAPKLSKATTVELVALLAHPNAWHRDTAHRLLFERQDKAAVPLLRRMLKDHDSALARLHALWSLSGLAAMENEDLLAALADQAEHVRAAAISIAEPSLAASRELRKIVTLLAVDPTPRVCFQAVLSLGEAINSDVVIGLIEAAKRDLSDPWMRAAILSSAGSQIDTIARASLRIDAPDRSVIERFVADACTILGGSGSAAECGAFLDELSEGPSVMPATVESALLGLANGAARSSQSPMDFATNSATRKWLETVVATAPARALDPSLPAENRLRAIALLRLAEFGVIEPLAVKLLDPAQPEPVRTAFLRQLQQSREGGVARVLLEAWPTLTPSAREAAAATLVSRKEWLDALLGAIEAQRVKPAEISAAVRATLQRSPTAARAAKLFAATGSRQEVLARYQPALTMRGDATKGRAVFDAACATCHLKGKAGRDFGPNLATVAAWSAEQLLTNILDPNREVSPNFTLYTAELKDGRALAGTVAAETEAALVLKGIDGVEQSLVRSEIATLRAAGTSPMPDGLEPAISIEQMADLIAFLRDAP